MENENMEQEESILTLTDENGQDMDFEYLDCLTYEGKEYLVLMPAAGDTLDDAWPACQIYHIVIEREIAAFAFTFAVEHLACQALILGKQFRYIGFLKRIRCISRRYYRLDRQLLEAEIGHVAAHVLLVS